MALDVSRFVTPEQTYGGLYQMADTLEKNKLRDQQLLEQQQSRKLANTKFLQNYLDPKDFLTGTNYDPMIVGQLNNLMNQGAELASKGADTPTIMMALNPAVSRLNDYSQKAKLINNQINQSVSSLKQYHGYDINALTQQAKKNAFYDASGNLKDISTLDPDTNWVGETIQKNPDLVTTSAGLDDFVNKVPMGEYSPKVQTMVAGKKRLVGYDAKYPFYMGVQTDAQGNTLLDKSGNPLGLDVVSSPITDDKGMPITNPQTNEPFRAMEQNRFNAIMNHNPDIANYVRGQAIQHFKQIGDGTIPPENSPQFEMMQRSILYDELKSRNRSVFKPSDIQTESAQRVKLELGLGSNTSKEPTINDVYGKVNDIVDEDLANGYTATRFNKLSGDAQNIIMGYAKESPNYTKGDNIFLKKEDGNINIYKTTKGENGEQLPITNAQTLLTSLPKVGTNIKATPGVKGKEKVVVQGEPKTQKISNNSLNASYWKKNKQ